MASQEDPAGSCRLSVRKRPLTSAEKQKNYRERLKQSPERYERFKQCEAKRRRERTKTHQPTEEEIALQRKKSRERVRKHRLKKKLEAMMKEKIFEEQVYMSEESHAKGLILPEAYGVTEEVARAAGLNHDSSRNTEYLQSTMELCPEMNLSELNIGDYFMHAHDESNREESDNSTVKLEYNRPCENDLATYDMNLEVSVGNSAHVTTGNIVGKGQILKNGTEVYREESPDQVPAGPTVLSVEETTCEESSKQKKRKRKPLTAAERQRNYIARLKAQPEKWEEHKRRNTVRRKIIQVEHNSLNEVDHLRKKKNQRKCTRSIRWSKKHQRKDTGDADACSFVQCNTAISTTLEDFQSKFHSHLDETLPEVKVEPSNIDSYAISSQGNLVNGFRVSQSSILVKEMQNHLLTTSPKTELVGGSLELSPKRKPLTPAERQRNYRARKKEKTKQIEEFKSRETEKRKMMLIDEDRKRQRAAERQREYRRRKKALASAKDTEAVTMNTRFNQLESCRQNVDGSCTNIEVHDELTREVESEVGQSAFHGDGSLTIVEKMQEQWLAWPLLSSPFAFRDFTGQLVKKKPLTAAERQRQYRERLKAKPERWKQYKARESERRKRTQEMQKFSEGSALEQRKKAEEEQRGDPGQRGEESGRMEGTEDPGGYLLNTDSHLELKLGHVSDSLIYHVKQEKEDCSLADHNMDPANQCGLGCVQTSPSDENCQNELPMSTSGQPPVKTTPRRRRRRKKAMTAAERQRQYRARLKAKPERWEQYKARESERRKRTHEIQAALEQRKDTENVHIHNLFPNGEKSYREEGIGKPREGYLMNTDPHLDKNFFEVNSSQYSMNAYGDSNNLGNLECSLPDGVDHVLSQVKQEEQNCSPVKPDIDSTNGNGDVQNAHTESKSQSEPLVCPSNPLSVKSTPKRRPRRKKAMTGAERQRQYRQRQREKHEKENQEELKGTETPITNQDFKLVSENSVHPKLKETQLPAKREVNLNEIVKEEVTFQPVVKKTVSRRQQYRRVKAQEITGIAMGSMKRVNRTKSTAERCKQQAEAQLAYRRMKGRERMRKFRLRQKQKLEKANGESGECVMPKIIAVWSMDRGSDQGMQENITQKCNMPETDTKILDDLAKLVPEDYIAPVNRMDSGHLVGYPSGSTTSCTDIPLKLPILNPQPSKSRNKLWEEAPERNAIPFRSRRMTSAERQRRYRKKLQQNPEKWAAYKEKEYQRYLAKKATAVNETYRTMKQNRPIKRKCTSDLEQSKNFRNVALDNAMDSIGNGSSRGKSQASLISGKCAVLTEERAVGRRGKSRLAKSPEEIERIRKANRERQRRHRARKVMEQRMQRTRSLANRTDLVQPDCIATDEIEKTEIIRKGGEQYSGQGMSQDNVGSGFYCSTRYSMCSNLSSLANLGPRNRGRPRLPRPMMNQPTVKNSRGRPRRQTSFETEKCADVALNNRLTSVENEGPGEVVVSSAGNIPMVIKMPSVKGQKDPEWEEIPEVIPCDPPEAVCDWGNIDLDHFKTTDEEVSQENIELTEPVTGEGEGECVHGSARRKAFFPTKHDSADLTFGAASVSETLIEDS